MSALSKTAFRFLLDLHSGVPAYRQIIDAVLGGIASGTLQPGEQLPTVRQLAVDLSINPNTGLLTGIPPTVMGNPIYTFTIIASNAAGTAGFTRMRWMPAWRQREGSPEAPPEESNRMVGHSPRICWSFCALPRSFPSVNIITNRLITSGSRL